MPPIRESLTDFLSENFGAFQAFESGIDSAITQVARRLDPGFHEYVLGGLTKVFIEGLQSEKTLRARLVIDSNIVAGDAFRVARGRPSSTERMFQSPFLELLAPEGIREEVQNAIREDLPRDASRHLAEAQAERLLNKLTIVPKSQLVSIQRARQLLDAYDPEDIPFLALAFDVEAEAIVSRDTSSIGQQSAMTRWDIGQVAQVVGLTEGGSLSIVIVGKSASAILEAVEAVMVVIAKAFETILSLFAALLSAAAEGVANLLSRIPPEVLQAIGIVAAIALVGFIIALIVSPEFRESTASKVGRVIDKLTEYAGVVVDLAKRIANAVYSVLVWLWNLLLPLTAAAVVAAGVLFYRITALISRCEQKATSSG